MFAPDLGTLVHEHNIDGPHNGLLLTGELHRWFGKFYIWLEAPEASYVPTFSLTEGTYSIATRN
jgi:hypothetical protein